MAQIVSKEDAIKAWRAAWRQEDFTWPGLAKKAWQGYSVFQLGEDLIVAETKSLEIYRVNNPSALWLQGMQLDEKRVLRHPGGETAPPPPPEATVSGGADAPKPIRDATLQDYWRADPMTGRLRSDDELIAAGELIVRGPGATESGAMTGAAAPSPPSGATNENGGEGAAAPPYPPETYHLAHLPMTYDDGAPTPKAALNDDALDALIGARLAAAGATQREGYFVNRPLVGPDRAAQLHGGVWFSIRAPGSASVSARFDNAAFQGDARFNNAAFQRNAGFVNATFQEDATFINAAFQGGARFYNAAFQGDARFFKAAFQGTARFDNAAFQGYASFDNAAFQGYAFFTNAAFQGDARFDYAAFQGDAIFANAAVQGYARFAFTAFGGALNFREAHCAGAVDFRGLGAELRHAGQEQTITLAGGPNGLEGKLIQSGGAAPLAKRAFLRASFERCVIEGDANFSNRDFLEPASFDGARFGGVAEFHGSALHQGVSFQGTQFEAVAHAPQGRSARDLKEGYIAVALTLTLLNLAKRKRRPIPSEASWRAILAKQKLSPELRAQTNARFGKIEAAFRTLKLAQEGLRNKIEEQTFYRRELIARRQRTDVPGWERAISNAYGAVADYGGSVVRPLGVLLFAVVPAFWLVFYLWAGALQPGFADRFIYAPGEVVDDDVWRALGFSLRNVLPFGGFGDDVRNAFYDGVTPGWRVGMGVAATTQSIIALTLAFLSSLAVRRRFQIS